MIELHADVSDIGALLRVLTALPKGLEKAASRAINKTLVSTRAYMVTVVRRDYQVKAGVVRQDLHIRKANYSRLYGKVHGAGSPGIPLLAFVRGSKNAPSTRRLKSGAYRPLTGVPVLIRKDKGKMAASGVFLARMASGHVGAFKRIEAMQDRIRETFGPSPIKILAADRYDEEIEDYADDVLQKNFRHEADYILSRMGLR